MVVFIVIELCLCDCHFPTRKELKLRIFSGYYELRVKIICIIPLNSTTSKTAQINIFKIYLNSKHLLRQLKCDINICWESKLIQTLFPDECDSMVPDGLWSF